MKSLAKLSLVAITVAGLLLGGFILVRHKKPQWFKPKTPAKRYPHEHLPSSDWEPKARLGAYDHILHKGETLASIAKLRYGHEKYAGVIKLYNHIEDELHIEEGTVLRLPDMSAILADEGLTQVAAREVELLLCSRAKYDRVVDKVWALRQQDSHVAPDDIKRELLEAADDLQEATERLRANREGVSRAPASMIGQLEGSMHGMRELTRDDENPDPNSYDIDIVQQRYGLAFSYAIIWARDGFK